MGFIEYPGPDLALGERTAQRPVAQLFRRDQHDGRIAQANAVQSIGAFRHRQHAIDRDAGTDAPRLEPRHLVGHQRHQGRDHHGKRAGLVVARKGGHLIAERFTGARGQETQHMAARHGRLHDRLLHGPAVVGRRFRAKAIEAEPAFEFPGRVVSPAAPGTARIRARRIAKAADQATRFGKLMADPGRHHRVAARDGQPGQRISQWPATL